MSEETITLIQIETKQTKTGTPMWTCVTNVGKMSVFDKTLAEDLFTLIGKNIVVEIETQGQYKNLKRVIRIATNQTPMNEQVVKNPREMRVSVCLSYAKDLCIGGKIELKDIPSQSKALLSLYEEMLDIKFV